MYVYILNNEEIEKIKTINTQNCINKTNVLMIICDHGFGPVLDYDDLITQTFKQYDDVLKSNFDILRKVEVEVVDNTIKIKEG